MSAEPKSLCRIILSLLANAERYSDAGEITVKLNVSDCFASLIISQNGHFDAGDFQRALVSDGSLGFVRRTLSVYGGAVFMTECNGFVSLALKLPLCFARLPLAVPYTAEELLCDRLSVLYGAFCAH